MERTSRAWDAYETRLRWPRFRLKKRGHRSIDPVAHLLVHDVVEEDVVVVGVLVLLGQLGLRVHEVRGRAAVRFLARIRSLALARSLHAAHGGVRTQIARAPMFFSNATLSVTLPPVNEAFTVRFESGRGASYIRRFAEVGSLARDSWVGTTPTRARVGLSQRPMEESFHEKVFRYQPNVIIWFSAIQSAGERWRELLERASAI